jgi:hypothetical protein
LRDAYKALARREAETQLAIKFLQPDLVKTVKAKEYIQKAVEDKVKMTVGDIDALILVELETEKIGYDLAKFDCDTSDKDFAKLEPQLSFYQSLLKHQ